MRTLLLSLCLLVPLSAPPPAGAQRILTLDWTLAETLTALGQAPDGVAQIGDYHGWVGAPELPEDTIDLGLRNQPSMELMAALEPDLILTTPMFAGMEERLSGIGPIRSLPLYDPAVDTWRAIEDMTRSLGELTGRAQAAERLIEDTRAMLSDARSRLAGCDPLLIVQIADERHLRIYGGSSLYQAVLDKLGLRNAWTGPVNDWGYRLAGWHELAGIEGRLVIIRPAPLGALQRIQENALWRQLPVASRRPPIVLPPVWSLGGLSSAQRFARLLEQGLRTP
ncbi:iron-siderophore ABC transporter substrate-binding protein [uncultured Castellaniella sp.]|uniref:iron-siderophore ABC transporter substrate-binding protein n=1 Tax=uncultured Castellaniella sp. TaxID=647907 RepID=UPI002629308D|nr:iron-siderophore ABC transporter substrate-binding protein [uncultured Castellaniella sp.]